MRVWEGSGLGLGFLLACLFGVDLCSLVCVSIPVCVFVGGGLSTCISLGLGVGVGHGGTGWGGNMFVCDECVVYEMGT